MKLRIRSLKTKESSRIEIADSSSLIDLKVLISTKISSSSSPISPQSITVSLNQNDELISSSPTDSLKSLGIASGDLLFYSQTLSPNSAPTEIGSETLISVPHSTSISGQILDMDVEVGGKEAPLLEKSDTETLTVVSDVESPSMVKSPSVPYFLKRVMELEREEIKGNLGFLVVALHAVFMESGFVVCNGDGSRLPEHWNLAAASISIQYTLPELLDQIEGRFVKLANLKFSVLSNQVVVYGSLSGEPNVYRLHLDLTKVLPLLVFLGDTVSGEEQEEVFKFWKTVKDCLCLPLLIDICHKNGLPPPPCFARLPSELKFNIVELLTGVDVARIGCTSKEMRCIALSGELWKKKFMEEFGLVDDRETAALSSWKEKFKRLWVRRRDADETRRSMMESRYVYRRASLLPFAPPRLPAAIGGDYDRFPAIGGFGSMGPGLGFLHPPAIGGFGSMGPGLGFLHPPARRNFSPHCNLGGHGDDFLD